MQDVYTYCAVIGGTLIVAQFVLNLLGLGHDFELHDVPVGDFDVSADGADHGDAWFVGLLSFRAVTTALTVFGLVGLWTSSSQRFGPLNSFVLALIAGGAVLYGVGWLLRKLYTFGSEGTLHIENALGETGRVYLSIPGRQTGAGKVTVTVQGRSTQFRAMTPEDDLASGTPVLVTGVLGPGTLEVVRAHESQIEIEGRADVQS